MAHHDQVNASSDTINSIIDQDWLVTEALYRALKWKARSDDTDEMRAWINDAAAEVEMARRKHRLLDPGFQFKPILTPDDTPRSQYGPRYP